MSQQFISLQQISQEDNHTFRILWNDQLLQRFTLKELQEHCPCAGCAAKKEQGPAASIPDDVKAVRIASVGRYAIKVSFSKGCSSGIYDFDLLRKIGQTISTGE